MGRKSSSKGSQPIARPSAPTPPSRSGFNPLLAIAIAAVVVALAVIFWRQGAEPSAEGTAASSAATGGADRASSPSTAAVEKAASQAKLGPRQQASFPPIPFQGYQPPRSKEVITAAYEFAAEHPEILSYVPCFCGCENSGHGGNHDCFVKSRNAAGDVVEWDEHGVECAVCIDVANRSRQMHASGASVRDIRAAIDKEFAPVYPGKMATPAPPAAHGTH
jgi:Protein of unknown function with PCYCGC motif